MRSPVRLRIAALACALTLAACGSQPSDRATSAGSDAGGGSPGRSSAGSPDADRTSADDDTGAADSPASGIADDFPLSAGMGDAVPVSRTGTGLRSLELCGTSPLRGLGTRDRMVADNSGGEALDTRELVLLGSPDAARLVAQAFTDLPNECGLRTTRDGMETTTEVRESAFGAAPAAVLVQGYVFDGEPGPGHLVVHVVPVGAALLVTQTYGEWPDVSAGVTETGDRVAATVAAMSVFDDPDGGGSPSSEASPESGPESVPTPAGVTPVPGDFPLGVGLPEDDGETTVSPPSPDGEGMGVVELCGQEVWPVSGTAGGTRRLVTGALGPEYFDGRELVVHADVEAASNAMAAFRRAAQTCRTHDNQVWTVLDRDTGHDTITVGLTYDQGLGSSVFQVTRVGSARLMVQTYGEGSLASLDEQADGVTGTTEQILPAMCVFTRTGC